MVARAVAATHTAGTIHIAPTDGFRVTGVKTYVGDAVPTLDIVGGVSWAITSSTAQTNGGLSSIGIDIFPTAQATRRDTKHLVKMGCSGKVSVIKIGPLGDAGKALLCLSSTGYISEVAANYGVLGVSYAAGGDDREQAIAEMRAYLVAVRNKIQSVPAFRDASHVKG